MKYRHRNSGVQVQVREGKVMDPQVWEPIKPAEPKPRRRTVKSDDDD